MIHYVEGDLLEAKEEIIGHQVNCMGTFGAGSALQMRNSYPEAYFRYSSLVSSMRDGQELLLGQCQLVKVGEEKYIANLFGQYGYGTAKRQTSYKALKCALLKLKRIAERDGYSIALPHGIGSNLAGGEWEKILMLIENVFADYDVTIYKLPQENELLLKKGV